MTAELIVNLLFCCSWLQVMAARVTVSYRVKTQTTLLLVLTHHWGKGSVVLVTVAHLLFS